MYVRAYIGDFGQEACDVLSTAALRTRGICKDAGMATSQTETDERQKERERAQPSERAHAHFFRAQVQLN